MVVLHSFFLALEELFILEAIDIDGASLYNLKLAIHQVGPCRWIKEDGHEDV